MKKALIAVILGLLIVGVFVLPVIADEMLAKFDGGIGVIPVSSGQGTDATATTVTRNIVRGVQPAGQIWVIDDLEAEVTTNGHIKVAGEGLVLGGGKKVGRATGQHVFVTLICGAVAPFSEHHSNLAGVRLAPNGDFKIDDVLSPAPTICDNPVLLIRSAASRKWFAAGILESGDNGSDDNEDDEDDDVD
jgi:hypothetical protein